MLLDVAAQLAPLLRNLRHRVVTQMTDVRTSLTDALRGIGCGVEYVGANKIADELLSLSGIAIVELPEPIEFDDAYNCIGRWRVGEYGAVIAYADGYLIDDAGNDLGGVDMTRQFAAALLAAAKQVERSAEADPNLPTRRKEPLMTLASRWYKALRHLHMWQPATPTINICDHNWEHIETIQHGQRAHYTLPWRYH